MKRYGDDIFFVINYDKDFTGALEIKLSPIGKPDQGIFVHEKNGKKQGFPSKDWPGFWSRFDAACASLQELGSVPRKALA